MFQYKILHRILPTNKKLSSDCDYCGQAEESLKHLFCECDIATVIWQDVVDWLGKQLLVTTKMIIFKNKVEKKTPGLAQIIASLKLQFKTEKSIASNNNKEKFFNGFWSPLWDKVSGE